MNIHFDKSSFRHAHRVDMIRELGPFILVDRMTDIGIGTLYGDFSSSCSQYSRLPFRS